MAEEDNSQDKTEEPSQRKLDKAAEDGQVLSSKENNKSEENLNSNLSKSPYLSNKLGKLEGCTIPFSCKFKSPDSI